jgi:hypothetical protein
MIIHTCYSPVKKIFFEIGVQGTSKCPNLQEKLDKSYYSTYYPSPVYAGNKKGAPPSPPGKRCTTQTKQTIELPSQAANRLTNHWAKSSDNGRGMNLRGNMNCFTTVRFYYIPIQSVVPF